MKHIVFGSQETSVHRPTSDILQSFIDQSPLSTSDKVSLLFNCDNGTPEPTEQLCDWDAFHLGDAVQPDVNPSELMEKKKRPMREQVKRTRAGTHNLDSDELKFQPIVFDFEVDRPVRNLPFFIGDLEVTIFQKSLRKSKHDTHISRLPPLGEDDDDDDLALVLVVGV